MFPDGSAVDRLLQTTRDGPPSRVIGVVGNIRFSGPQRNAGAEAFQLAQGGRDMQTALSVVMRLRPGGSMSGARLRQVAQAAGVKVVIGEIRTGSDWLAGKVKTFRHRTVLLGLLGGFGLLLTLVGIASMTAYAVARRTREIGVRIALGAKPAAVVGTVVRDAAWPLGLGIAAGLLGAYFSTAVVRSFLFETTPHDPGTFAVVSVAMVLAACAAAWVPARRAARVNPIEALRAE